jgi:hypothetical protein
MKNNNTTSSSSTAQKATESNHKADSPLDGAACSASSILEDMAAGYMILDADYHTKYQNHQNHQNHLR